MDQAALLSQAGDEMLVRYTTPDGKLYGFRNGVLTEIRETVYNSLSMTLNSTITLAHGVLPARVKIELVCTAAINGYAVGDVTDITPIVFYLSNLFFNVMVAANSTNIYLIVSSQLSLPIRPVAGAGFNPTSANFTMRARVYDYI